MSLSAGAAQSSRGFSPYGAGDIPYQPTTNLAHGCAHSTRPRSIVSCYQRGGNLTYREMLAAHRVLTAGTGMERGYRPAVKIDPQGTVTAYRGERLAATAEGVVPNTIRHRQRRGVDPYGNIWL